MNPFFELVKKEMLHTWRDKRSLFVIIATPIMSVLIFGYAIRTELKETPIAFYDKTKDETTLKIKNTLISSGFFVSHGDVSSIGQADKLFQSSNLKAVLVFDYDFSSSLKRSGQADVQIILDSSEPNISATVLGYLTNILSDTEALDIAHEETRPMLNPVVKMVYNANKQSAFFFVPGVIAIVIMFLGQKMSSVAIAKEKERGSIALLLLSPVHPIQIMAAKVSPYFLLSLINALICFLISFSLFDMPFKGSLWLLTFETFLYIGVNLSLGIFIASFTRTQQAALIISIVGALVPSYVLGGYVFPIESMPTIVQWISHAIPAKWFIIIIRIIILKGLGLEAVWKETVIMSGMMIALLLFSAMKFSSRYK
jgi:ABC-2 type transport system permease protein